MILMRTLSSKITFLVGIMSLVLTSLSALYVIDNEYRVRRQALLASFETLIASSSNQQRLALHFHDSPSIETIVDSFFERQSLLYVALYQPDGTLIIERASPEYSDSPPALDSIRKDVTPFEKGLVKRVVATTGERVMDMTLPIFSFTSPINTTISRNDFMVQLTNLENGEGSHLLAHINLGISEAPMRDAIKLFAGYLAGICLLIVIASIVISRMITARVTKPLTRLVSLAGDISSGKLDKISISGSSEIQEIAAKLNSVIDSLSTHKTQIDVDNRLLGMQVEERNKQLSTRSDELNSAKKDISDGEQRLQKLAYLDTVTALPNRRYFDEQFQLLLDIAIREQHILAMIFVDIDNFKRINESLGHSAGDQLLKEVAHRLKDNVRDTDIISLEGSGKNIVSRFGGDAFTVILNKIDQPKSVEIVVGRFLVALAQPMNIDGHEVVITLSIGIALSPVHGSDTGTLLSCADTAMHHAKKAGKNGYRIYSDDMAKASVEHLKLEADLRKAIKQNELELYFQPQVNIDTGEIIGAETLVRWNHPELGFIPPLEFVTLAEQCGLIIEMGDWVLVQACKYMKEFLEKGLNLQNISINVSGLQFGTDFNARLHQILDELELDPRSIIIELTEGIIMDNVQQTIDQLVELKSLGVGLSVDDFGTGYSSLSYLARFPLSELKIDRCFVTEFDKSENDSNLIAAIIAMGLGLNLDIVAEGVETPEQFTFLKNNNVKIIQGYLFSKPLPVTEFQILLKHHQFGEQLEALSAGNLPDQARALPGVANPSIDKTLS
jgi:diguanylate cyclase (GGDEF)-like protein